MLTEKIYVERSLALALKSKMRDYGQLVKFRLNLTVVFSTFIGFLLGSPADINWFGLLMVVTGGFLTVGAANGINQIIEGESDKLMKRTENRPLVTNRMSIIEAGIATLIMGVIGVFLIGRYLNEMSALLSFVSLCLYGFLYTPLKKVTPLSVYIGAIPGALPPVIGYVAANGEIGTIAWIMFAIQFIWQLPHFYAIAWLLEDDYKRAGLKLMPIGAAADKGGAAQIMFFAALLLPISLLPWLMGVSNVVGSGLLVLCSGYFFWQSLVLYRELSKQAARRLMFGSFLYLPVVFLILLLVKLI